MRLDYFRNLPPEIIMDIFSRLPIESILSCKCVRKSWVGLIESPEFSELHLSKSVPGLAVYEGAGRPKPYKLLEFADERRARIYSRYYNVLFRFKFSRYSTQIHSSVNGLLFMYDMDSWRPRNLYICNPITRDYFELPPPPNCEFQNHTFGFGVSKMTGQYKVVKVFRLGSGPSEYEAYTECEIYTLGTGLWRSIELDNPLNYKRQVGAFLNGNLQWLVLDSNRRPLISCFDLETELFTTFSSPPNGLDDHVIGCLSTLEGCLCVCCTLEDEIVVWFMKEYGNEKSWTKEYTISMSGRQLWGYRFPIKVFKNGDILIAEEDGLGLICYSNKAIRIQETVPFASYNFCRTSIVFYTPSFLSLKMFPIENVCSL